MTDEDKTGQTVRITVLQVKQHEASYFSVNECLTVIKTRQQNMPKKVEL